LNKEKKEGTIYQFNKKPSKDLTKDILHILVHRILRIIWKVFIFLFRKCISREYKITK